MTGVLCYICGTYGIYKVREFKSMETYVKFRKEVKCNNCGKPLDEHLRVPVSEWNAAKYAKVVRED